MVYSITYRRPRHVGEASVSTFSSDEKKYVDDSIKSGSTGRATGIPDALSFDRIVSGGTCPPCTLREFMNYLKHIELAAENLQFFLWHRDYCRRFGEMPESERVLAPEWTEAHAVESEGAPPKSQVNVSPETAALMAKTKFDVNTKVRASRSVPGGNDVDDTNTLASRSMRGGYTAAESYAAKAAQAFEDADVKLQPFTIQPFREEINRVIATYLFDGAPRQLNLSSRERATVLQALGYTTHPTALREVAATVEYSLRRQAHPNFIRWTICNGNRPRVVFARGLGVTTILLGFVAAILITLSSAGRGYRALAAIGWVIGVATLVAAWKGMCVVLHGLHHRHLRPWELFDDDEAASADFQLERESFDSGPSNSYEDAPWVAKYEKRNVIRKVFDRELWIQEPALRQIQDTIFLQAVGVAFVVSLILTAAFVALPKGRFY